MKRRILAALLCAALFALCGCSNPGPSATPTPTATVPIESRIAQYADADVTVDEGDLIIGIRVDEADIKTACTTFFAQAEDIYIHCISGGEYTGVSFSFVHSGNIVAAFFVLPGAGGMQVFEPVVYDTDYMDAVKEAFYASDFAKSLAA